MKMLQSDYTSVATQAVCSDPLAVVKDAKALLTHEIIEKVVKKFLSWTDLLDIGIIELVDANEEENCYVSIDPKRYRIYIPMWKSFHQRFLGSEHQSFRIQSIINLQEIHMKVRWLSRVLDSLHL